MKKNENIIINFLYIIFSIYCRLIIFINDNKIKSYLIFPLEYLKDKYYNFNKGNSKQFQINEEIIQKIYYKNFIIKIQIGTPALNYSFLLNSNNENYYITSINNSTINREEKKFSFFYSFNNKDFYNESLSLSYKKSITYYVSHGYSNYKEICLSTEKFLFNKDKDNISDLFVYNTFPIKLTRINEDNIVPGYIGLLFNNTYDEYQYGENFIIELKKANLIDNHYWFFNIDEISPIKKDLKGQFIIGGLPHEIFPNKFSINDFIYTNSYKTFFDINAWRIYLDRIYVYNNDTQNFLFENTNMILSYEIYNLIGNKEFHEKIKEVFMNKLINEKKCFIGNFSENNIFISNMTFYYCYKSIQNFLYQSLPNIKFYSANLGFTFELSNEELFYIKDNYIYLMILFNNKEYNYWIMGQILTTKYNFVFNNDKKQIGLYKKVNKIKNNIDKYNNNDNINKTYLIFIIIILAIIFICIGLFLGRKIHNKKRKIIVNELIEERDYEYKSHNDQIKSNYNTIGNNNKSNIMIEMNKKIYE